MDTWHDTDAQYDALVDDALEQRRLPLHRQDEHDSGVWVRVGLTVTAGRGYVPTMDGYRKGAEQEVVWLPLTDEEAAVALLPEDGAWADAVYAGCGNSPFAEAGLTGVIQHLWNLYGSGCRSVSVGDTLALLENGMTRVAVSCERLGWEYLGQPEETLGSCGCQTYHAADCPTRNGSWSVAYGDDL